jgi:hypothetical protein
MLQLPVSMMKDDAPEMSAALGEGSSAWMERAMQDNFRAKSEAQPAGGQRWAIDRLALHSAAWGAYLSRWPGWSGPGIAVCGHDE